ncbi:MAG: GAF domain-containing protein [Methyloprofundus sp.]|nr:GAF domain-containing protein [Methyloprofundus sp.]
MSNQRIIKQLDKLIEISIALSEEKPQNELLEMILHGAKSITNADGGTLYLVEDGQIKMSIIHSCSLNIHLGGTSDTPINLPHIPIYLDDGQPNYKNVVSYAFHHNKAINIPDAYNNTLFDFSGAKKFDKLNKYHSKSFLAIPLKNHENDTIGILQLINAIHPETKNIIEFDSISMRFTEALASQAAIVITKQRLIFELEEMFESLIELIATAIDDKSPYTGGHCRRVPELTSLIAEAAHDSQSNYLKDFQLSNADRYQLKVAGWLHDCGKLTTPEYVVDKATKLETIYDRIETIETRFEVLKRDTEIKYLKEQIDALKQGKVADAESYHLAQEKLNDDFNFIKKSNTGSEFMPPEEQERIKEIAQQTWVKSGKKLPFLSADEILNLTISRGTLTNSERGVIQQHISTTIAMLDKINFPKHLQNVPEYAGAHHERMDGKGYPNKLTREQMSIPARAMAIADVFEALTAADRPYKKPKTLSEALFILEKMKQDNHIDPDIYDAFIQEKVYLNYAKKFLDASQIDLS